MREDVARLLATVEFDVHDLSTWHLPGGSLRAFEATEMIVIYYVLEGYGVVDVEGFGRVEVSDGAILLVPPRRVQAVIAEEIPANSPMIGCSAGGDRRSEFDGASRRPRELHLVRAVLNVSCGGQFGLLDGLAAPVLDEASEIPPLRQAFELMVEERNAPDVGSRALTAALMKQCLILLVRRHLRRGNPVSPFFQALSDPQLLSALVLILTQPGADLRISRLAAEAGMTRATFAKRFITVLGQNPNEFVHKVRLRHAAHLLATTPLPIKSVAWSTGFSSRSHFSRAFKAGYGIDPSAYREQLGNKMVNATAS